MVTQWYNFVLQIQYFSLLFRANIYSSLMIIITYTNWEHYTHCDEPLADAKKDVVDSLLRASGCLDYSVHQILVQIPAQVKYAITLKFEICYEFPNVPSRKYLHHLPLSTAGRVFQVTCRRVCLRPSQFRHWPM